MTGVEPDSMKHIFIVIMLECLFLSFALIFVGHGIKEWHKRNKPQHLLTASAGVLMAVLSFYATYLLLDL